MKTDLTEQAGANAAGGREAAEVSDPFAVDLFARGRKGANAASAASVDAGDATLTNEARVVWSSRLPRVSRAQLRLSNALDASLPSLSAASRVALARVLSQYLRLSEDEIAFTDADVREKEFTPGAVSADASGNVWATLTLAPAEGRVVVALPTEFAAASVDRVLGGEGVAPETLRPLSRTELASVEFLLLCLIRELHRETGTPLLRLEGVAAEPPAWLAGAQEAAATTSEGEGEQARGRGIVATFGLRAGALGGLTSFYFTRDALTAFDGLRRSPLFASSETGDGHESYKRIAPDVRLRPVLGETDVSAVELADLETGDVVVVARPLARLEAGRLSGRLAVRLGDGASTVLVGAIAPVRVSASGADEIAAGGGAAVRLLIEQIRQGGELHSTERWSMEQEQPSDDSNAGAIALEEITLTVHVELAERRLSLDELARLRVGQLLPLGCQPTDPVDLVADGRRIARGELVEIEGQLGVRVTQVTG
ncbi:MAG TPA: FliM/FliN family flagellar motor switch protein [Pyrinomonadaceae bacterium]|nr:FliM/FliN family flagellar motor switch protein [Pyrinomonadaceae bacterium]